MHAEPWPRSQSWQKQGGWAPALSEYGSEANAEHARTELEHDHRKFEKRLTVTQWGRLETAQYGLLVQLIYLFSLLLIWAWSRPVYEDCPV